MSLLNLETYRHTVPDIDGYATLFARIPQRKHLDDPDGLLVEGRVDAPDYRDLVNSTFVGHAEAKYYLALDVVFLGELWILDVVIDELEEFNIASGK